MENLRCICVYTHAENLVTIMYVCMYIYTYVCAMEDGSEVALHRCIFTHTENLVTLIYIYMYIYMEYEGQVLPVRMCSRSKFRYIHIHVCMYICINICIHVCVSSSNSVCWWRIYCTSLSFAINIYTRFRSLHKDTRPPTQPHPHPHIFVHVV